MSGIDSIIETARSYLGTKEGSQAHSEIIEAYNKARYSDAYCMTMNDPWCCAFVVAVFQMCGMESIIPCYAACDQMISIFTKWNRYYSRSVRSVRKGDIVFYDWNGDLSADHVGIVVQNQMGTLSVIEGNKSDSVSYRSIDSMDSCIIGYGVPNYEGFSNGTVKPKPGISAIDNEYLKSLPILQVGSKGVYVKIAQVLINYYGKTNLVIDGDYGPATKAAVAQYQTANGLEIDGVVGKETWTHLLVLNK